MPKTAVSATNTLPVGNESPDFESSMSELEGLVRQMESGDLSLEQSLAAYKRGAELVKTCRGTLAQAQQQVKILEGEMLRSFESDEISPAQDAG